MKFICNEANFDGYEQCEDDVPILVTRLIGSLLESLSIYEGKRNQFWKMGDHFISNERDSPPFGRFISRMNFLSDPRTLSLKDISPYIKWVTLIDIFLQQQIRPISRAISHKLRQMSKYQTQLMQRSK